MQPALSVSNLTVAYRQSPVLWNINLDIPRGCLVGVVGPNGSGKSTLIKVCVDLLEPQQGKITYFDNLSWKAARKSVAYLPQRESIDWDFPVNVLDVVLMGTYPRVGFFRSPPKDEIRFAKKCLERVHMLEFADRQISELSGGQQQRVFLARALAQKADLYFLDEPFAAVDAGTEAAILSVIRELKNTGATIVVVHHDLYSVMENMDYVALLNSRLVKFGITKEVMTIENLRLAYGGRLSALEKMIREYQSAP